VTAATYPAVVTQRKLDEILRSPPDADNALITFEDALDHEINSARDAHRELRDDAVGAHSAVTPPSQPD
jgi:low affinity Fe/Cu permease